MSLKLTIATMVVLVVAAGGWYVMRQETAVTQLELPMPASSPAPARDADELARRRLENIGSIRDLEPVPIRPNKP